MSQGATGRAGVIFDLDGVIIDSEGLQYLAYGRVLEPYGVRVSREEYGREWIAHGHGPEYAVKTYGLPMTGQELRELKAPVYHEILRAEVRLMAGIEDALRRLAPRFRLALATNSSRSDVAFVLERFGLQPFFDAVVTRELYERAKPEPDAFLAAAAALEIEPRRCLVIEDSFRGVAAAHRAGCRCVAVPNDFTRASDFGLAARVLNSLAEVTVELVEGVVFGDGS